MIFSPNRPTASGGPRVRALFIALACAAPLIGLVVVEPALGIALVLVVVTATMIVLSGLRLRVIAALTGVVAVIIAAAGGLALLGVVILRALRIATRADDLFGLLVASGVAMWFAFQSFVNIGMTIGIMPITGLPLPFVSYGGSAIFADMIAIGLLQSVHRRRTVFD